MRVHGTTKKVLAQQFTSFEKTALLPLPKEEFIISDISKATVHTNCHFSYSGNYYSAPYTYIGEQVDIIVMDNILKAFYKGKEIALHPVEKNEKGKHITNKNHYPLHKDITNKDIKSSYRKK
ncbi:MAG: hypothetical protein PWP27_2622 [Clostridiales bacterium]|nr:hypothetical protein [Clostridiales bacterium]MDK2934812.1 hypothetical protein [Clostridiales bacterium]